MTTVVYRRRMKPEVTPFERFKTIADDLFYPGFCFDVCSVNDVCYLQVRCPEGIDNETGERGQWRGRPWLLEPHLSTGEVVRTAFMAVMTAIEHETREQFRYMGETVCNPHFDL